MRDARDAEDKRLLAEGEIDRLLAGYVEIIRARSIAKLRDAVVGEDVAQAVCLRLWKELKLGKHRDTAWPFRVIVHKVIDYTCAGWYEQGWGELEWIEIDEPAADELERVDNQLLFEQFVEKLPPGDGEIGALTYLELLEPGEIALRVSKKPNAVYQAIDRNKKRLREWIEA